MAPRRRVRICDNADSIERDMPIASKEPSMTETPLRDRRQVVITDPLGLHLRHAARLVVLARSFRSDIQVVARGIAADAKSILDLVTLAAGCGTPLDIVARGPDAEEAVAALAGTIAAGLEDLASRGVAAA
jgi:phosphocarrier protein HPr